MQPFLGVDKAAIAQTQTAAATEAFSAWVLTQNAIGSPGKGCNNSMCNDVETVLDKEDFELAEVWLHMLFTHTDWLGIVMTLLLLLQIVESTNISCVHRVSYGRLPAGPLSAPQQPSPHCKWAQFPRAAPK